MTLSEGLGGYLVLFLAGMLVHEPWRWLGLAIGRRVDPDSEIFRWVRAVATALVAGLVIRLVLFPSGALADVPTWLRVGAFVAGLAVYRLGGRNVGAGIIAGTALMLAGQLAFSALPP